MWVCEKCKEQNSDSSTFCLSCGEKAPVDQVKRANMDKQQEAEYIRQQQVWQRAQMEQARAAQEQAMREQQMANEIQQREIDYFLKENGHTGYYEYKVLLVDDANGGYTDAEGIGNMLNYLGRNGWHLRCAYTNEIGAKPGYPNMGTMDQHVLIMERFIRFKM